MAWSCCSPGRRGRGLLGGRRGGSHRGLDGRRRRGRGRLRAGQRRRRDAEGGGRRAAVRVGGGRLRAGCLGRRDGGLRLGLGRLVLGHHSVVRDGLGLPRRQRRPLVVAHVGLGLEPVDQRRGVADAALRDRLGERVLVSETQLADLERRRGEQLRQAHPGQALVRALEDRHVAVVHADVVLLLVVPPGAVRAAAEQQHQQHQGAGDDRPAASAAVTVVIAVVIVVAVAAGAVAPPPAAGLVVLVFVLVAGNPLEALGVVRAG